MSKQFVLTFIFTAFSTLFGVSQHCKTYSYLEDIAHSHPSKLEQIKEKNKAFNSFLNGFVSPQTFLKSSCETSDYIIPVVFHILHQNGNENLSDDVITGQMQRLNLDFQALNTDLDDVLDTFKSHIGNPNFEFRLAKIDPQGNPTNGIVRYNTSQTNTPHNYYNSWTENRQWPREKYLNIYIGKNVGENTAGFTFLPAWVDNQPMSDAIFCSASYIGENDRTLTHEIGHWLNLDHLWGGSNSPGQPDNCQMDDGVSDTPLSIGWSSCTLEGESCGSLDNVENYMEYSFCSKMFTNGQAERMEALLNSSIAQRNNLYSINNLVATGVTELSTVSVSPDRKIICASDTLTLTDNSYYGVCERTWQADSSLFISEQQNDISLVYPYAGLYDIGIDVSNASDNLSADFNAFILVENPSEFWPPYLEDFESVNTLPSNRWIADYHNETTFQIHSSIGYNSSKSIFYDNFNHDISSKINLYSSAADLSGLTSAKISFNYAFAQQNTSNRDILRVLVSGDCGLNWTAVYYRVGSFLSTRDTLDNIAFLPADSTEWSSHQISVPSYLLNERFQIKFEFTPKGGNNLFLDNVHLFGTFDNTPTLHLPENLSDHVGQNVMLNWKSVDAANYYALEVDTALTFNSALLQQSTHPFIAPHPFSEDTEHALNNLQDSTWYFWRVRAIHNTDTSDWSETWSFLTSDSLTQNVVLPPSHVNETDLLDDQITIYPNPFLDHIIVENKAKEQLMISVYNNLGQKIEHRSITSQGQISTNLWPKGVYVFVFETKQQVRSVKKLVK